jgi:hypothetical protein
MKERSMADRTQATSVTTLEEFLPAADACSAPAVLLRKRSMTPSGSRRSVSLKVIVRDADLYRHLRNEVSEGQEVRVTTETDWDTLSEGDTLLAFEPVALKAGVAVTA